MADGASRVTAMGINIPAMFMAMLLNPWIWVLAGEERSIAAAVL